MRVTDKSTPSPPRVERSVGQASVLELRGVTKRWPRSPEPVLDSVDLQLAAGEIAWIGGSNGAGKTTLLRIASALIIPDSGAVSVAGRDPESSRREFHRQVGFLSAGNSGLYARLSVRHQLDHWATIAFVPRNRRTAAIGQAVEQFSLEPLLTQRGDRLSLGQRQRVRLAMTFLHSPRVVLLDEPGNSLDEEGKQLLISAVAGLTQRGGGAVWCAPTGEALEFPNQRDLVLVDGRLHPA